MRVRAVLLDVLVMLGVALLLLIVFLGVWPSIESASGAPWGWGYLLVGACYVLTLPAIIIPYFVVALLKGRRDSWGVWPALLASVAHPTCVLALFVVLLRTMPVAMYDNQALPMLALLVAPFIFGTVISYAAVWADSRHV